MKKLKKATSKNKPKKARSTSKIKGVIFDLDGTLLDTLQDIADSGNAVLKKLKFPTHSIEDYKIFVGDGMANLACRALPEGHWDLDTITKCVKLVKAEYSKRWYKTTKPYEGIAELLDELKERKIKIAVLSNKPHEFTNASVLRFLKKWKFTVIAGAKDKEPRKPDPTVALKIAAKMKLSPKEVIFAGDSNADMLTAKAAGMYAVGVLWGFRGKKELIANGAKAVIKKPQELLKFFK